jgi:hypothetical protein
MIARKRKQCCLSFPGILLFIVLFATAIPAEEVVKLSGGQTVYVPVYSHIYSGPKSTPLQLTATLSIRNTDRVSPITIHSTDYYDSEGKLLSKYVTEDLRLNALASTRYIVKTYDKSGGSGANFIVKWSAKEKVNAPIIEAVMTGQRYSFVTRGQVITDRPKQ